GRLARYGGGSSTIELIAFVRVDHLHRICRGSFRGVYARRPWCARALGVWKNRPRRSRSRHRTFAPTFVIDGLIRTRRWRHHRGSGLRRFLRDRICRLPLHNWFAHLRPGSGAWHSRSRFAFAFSFDSAGRLTFFAAEPPARAEPAHRQFLASTPASARGRGTDRRRTHALSSTADPRTAQPQLSLLPKSAASACILLSPRGGWTYIPSRGDGVTLTQMGRCSLNPGAEMLKVPIRSIASALPRKQTNGRRFDLSAPGQQRQTARSPWSTRAGSVVGMSMPSIFAVFG